MRILIYYGQEKYKKSRHYVLSHHMKNYRVQYTNAKPLSLKLLNVRKTKHYEVSPS